jgi:hypothetical protein
MLTTAVIDRTASDDKRPPDSTNRPARLVKSRRAETSPRTETPPRDAESTPKSGSIQEPAADALSASERYRQISLCAYFKAEKRGFAPGHMWEDWLEAEREVAEKNSSHPAGEPG